MHTKWHSIQFNAFEIYSIVHHSSRFLFLRCLTNNTLKIGLLIYSVSVRRLLSSDRNHYILFWICAHQKVHQFSYRDMIYETFIVKVSSKVYMTRGISKEMVYLFVANYRTKPTCPFIIACLGMVILT